MSTPLPPANVIRRQRSALALRKTLPPSKPIYRIPYVQPNTPPSANVPASSNTPVTPSPSIPFSGPGKIASVRSQNGSRTRQLRSHRMNLAKSFADDVQLQKADLVPSSKEPSQAEVAVRKPIKQNQTKAEIDTRQVPEKSKTNQREERGGFEKMFPRSKRLENVGGVSYVKSRTPDVVQRMPSARCSLDMEESYGNRVCRAIEEGRPIAELKGVSLEKRALELLNEDEVRMYNFWDSGKRRPPQENWETLKKEGKHEPWAGEKRWEYMAKDLSEVYGVSMDSVNAAAAREWWKRNDGWRPLVSAMGKVRKWSSVHEEEECIKAFEHFRCHLEWVQESVERYEIQITKAMRLLKRRLENVRRAKRGRYSVSAVEGERREWAVGGTAMPRAALEVELDGSLWKSREARASSGEKARDQMTD
eukprot:GFKZ01004766.1.p1 GENE.GFKZ01004766.1~~GFKZ01004766.1.p1  ORF type:complete len:473 (+),score=52.65 GFKZ01004766.1:160-1419(+)